MVIGLRRTVLLSVYERLSNSDTSVTRPDRLLTYTSFLLFFLVDRENRSTNFITSSTVGVFLTLRIICDLHQYRCYYEFTYN